MRVCGVGSLLQGSQVAPKWIGGMNETSYLHQPIRTLHENHQDSNPKVLIRR